MIRVGEGWALLVHGGAKEIAPEEEAANRDGMEAAARAGAAVLASGGSAVDAVEAAIRVLEERPAFNAGRGSALNAAGQIEMCSGIMDGRDLRVGAVAALRHVLHPISAAKALLPEREILLAGDGALAFAREQGLEEVAEAELKGEEGGPPRHDTVGAVAVDRHGNFAAGTSTGGLDGTRVGRVGDSPLPGCGFYADNHAGAVSLSGDGEAIARLTLASRIIADLARTSPDAAISEAVTMLPGVQTSSGDGGAILITKDGRLGWEHNSPSFAAAMVTSDMEQPHIWLHKSEEDGRYE